MVSHDALASQAVLRLIAVTIPDGYIHMYAYIFYIHTHVLGGQLNSCAWRGQKETKVYY